MKKYRPFAIWVFALYFFPAAGFSQDSSWFKCFTGTIDKYPITLHLYKTGHNYEGSYYYNSTEEPIELGLSEMKNGKLLLPAYINGDDEALEGILTGNSFKGSWTSGKKTLPFSLSLVQVQPSFDYVFVTGSKKVKKKEEYDRDECSYTASSIWPRKAQPDSLTYFLKRMIRKEFEAENDSSTIGAILLRKKKKFFEPASYSDEYEITESLQVAYQNNNLLSLSHFIYIDIGGAHGMYGIGYLCYDLQNKKQLSLDDIIDTLAVQPFIYGLLEKSFRKKYSLGEKEPLDETLLVKQIPMTDNVMLTSKGVGFGYTPYAIGPFAMGEILLFISYKDLEKFLRPAFKKLLQ